MTSALFAFIHHLLAFTLVAALAAEFVLIRQPFGLESVKKLLVADAFYGVSAILVFLVGFTRVFRYEKGSEFYFASATFNMKFMLFIAVGVLSIYPTISYFRWRKSLPKEAATENAVPNPLLKQQGRVKVLITLELIGVVGILYCAALMARGL